MSNHTEMELLSAYIDGETTPQETAQIKAHLPSCSDCRMELEQLEETKAWTSQAATVPIPPDLLETLERKISEVLPARRPLTHRVWIYGGSIATAMAASVALWVNFRTPPAISIDTLMAIHERSAVKSAPWEHIRRAAAYSTLASRDAHAS